MGSGTGLGGSGSVNGMVYTRGAREDYDEWPEGFRWDDVVPGGAEQRGAHLDEWRATLLPGDAREPAGDWPDVSYVQAAL